MATLSDPRQSGAWPGRSCVGLLTFGLRPTQARADPDAGKAGATGTDRSASESYQHEIFVVVGCGLGFELQVRLEAPQGQLQLSSTWVDLVRDLHPKPTPTQYYDSVIRTSVPAGSFVLSTVMHPGMESEQPTCETRGQVTPGAVITVTLNFSDRDGCSTVSG